MKQRTSKAQQSKQDDNPPPPMRERRWSAVLACPTPSDVEDTTKKFQPFEAWPEIVPSNLFCVLPTVPAWYNPKQGRTFTKAFGDTTNPYMLMDNYIRICPFLEPYKDQLFPMIREIARSHFGTELPETFVEAIYRNSYIVQKIFFALVVQIVDSQEQSVKLEWVRIMAQSVSPMDEFCVTHESMHLLSFRINRPVLKEFRDITEALFRLLRHQANTDTQTDFWVSFQELNKRLMDCLSIQLALEELRATLFALTGISTETQQKVIDQVYPEKREDQEVQIFRKLRSLTSNRWEYAGGLTMLAEYLNPADPQSELEKLLCELNAKKASTWSEEQWEYWLESRNELNELADTFEKTFEELARVLLPNAFISHSPDNKIDIICPDNIRITVFMESMRQQLAQLNDQPELIRSLCCPFMGESSSCCGFGNDLRGIWSGIPTEYQKKLNPPCIDCLKQN